jgi:ribosomal protein S12 methylthiotransferase
VPPTGSSSRRKHYAYLKISEGCNHRCSFCIIPSMRGDLVSRPVDEVLREAEKLVRGGVKELLVVSQDTSAYGVDVKYAERSWRGKRLPDADEGDVRRPGRAGRVDAPALRVSVSARGRQVIPLMAEGKDPSLPRHPVPARAARAC